MTGCIRLHSAARMNLFFVVLYISLQLIVLCAAPTTPTLSVPDVTSEKDIVEIKRDFYAYDSPKCNLSVSDPLIIKQVYNLLKIQKVVLIEYNLDFFNYTNSPLKIDNGFRPNQWFRTSSEHGQILLNLAFNYGILSMETLTLGTAKLNISIIESPPNCMFQADDNEQVYSIQYLLLRDFNLENKVKLAWKEGVCRQVVVDNNGLATFVHECVSVDADTSKLVVTYRIDNTWIQILNIVLLAVRVVALAFLPCVLVSMIKGLIKQRIPYVIRLKENSPLEKTIVITNEFDLKEEYISKSIEVLDLDKETGFPKLKNILSSCNYPINKPCCVKFQQYNVLVDYHRTQPEDTVNVGFVQTVVGIIFRCKLKEIGPFINCCQSEMMKYIGENKCFLLWITFWRKFSAVLLVAILPFPYYIRIIVYCLYEHDEVESRTKTTSNMQLRENFENSFLHYWGPTHPIFIMIYIIYTITALIVALAPNKHDDADSSHVLKRIVNSIRDLDEFSFARVVSYIFANFTYPFYKYGILGCIACLFYWVLALPLILFVCLIYSIPTFYFIFRMIYYCKKAIFVRHNGKLEPFMMYQVHKRQSQKKLLEKIKVESLVVQYAARSAGERMVNSSSSTKNQLSTEQDSYKRVDCWHCCTYILSTILCILAFCGLIFVLAELTVFAVQVIVFTIMGIIVNASYILRHVLVVAIIIIYCFDSFINMEKKYLKMNKMLFAEVTKRVDDLNSVTSLPSFLQENRGFKSEDLDEQAFYENTDAVVPKKHWMINDLVLFMDSEDTPRIPRKLYKEVCNIKVPGVPGPIYQGQLCALRQLAKVMFFVLLVVIAVMIFGEVYSLSSTNQLIATVAGSFLPLILRSFIFQQSSDIEVNTVTFKCHLDELIRAFHQNWPIYDLEFEFKHTEKTGENRNLEEPEFVIYLSKSWTNKNLHEVVSSC